jgi:hypothetical protein
MQSMVTDEAAPIEVNSLELGRLELGDLELPYVDLEEAPAVRNKLVLYDTEYTYVRSFPIRGHSAIMPAAVKELIDQGKRILVAERGERYYLYAA